MKIEAFTDRVAEAYGAADVQTVVNEGAAFISTLVNEMATSMRYKVGDPVYLRGDDAEGSVIQVAQVEVSFHPYPNKGYLDVLVRKEQQGRETYDRLEVPEDQAVLWSPRYRQELSKEVFEHYLDVFHPVL